MNTVTKLVSALFGLLLALPLLASPDIQHWQTDNGARVYFVEAPEVPLLDVRVVFDAGSARDGEAPGLAMLTNALVGEGAGDLDADGIAETFDRVGARFSSSSQRDMATLSLRSLTDPAMLEPALDTFALVLHQPTFAPDSLERLRQQMLTTLQHQRQRPGEIASRSYYHALYMGHPYGSPPHGTDESVQALQRTQVQDFHQRYYVAQNAVIAIVGALDRAQAEALAARLSQGMRRGEAAEPLAEVQPLVAITQGAIRHESSQTHILMGHPVMSRDDPDYFPLYVGNHILGGGGLVSRISEEIREKRGLAYSASSYFLPMRQKGPFTISMQTGNKNVSESIRVLRATLREFIQNGPTGEELQAAKNNLIGGFALNTDSNSKILGYIAMIGFYGLPLDYLDTFVDQVEAVSVEQIREAFQRRIDPTGLVLVMVGG
jgi:zinc protease